MKVKQEYWAILMACNADGCYAQNHAYLYYSRWPARQRMCELCADGEQAVIRARTMVQREFGISQRVAICWEYWAVRMDGDSARSVVVVGALRSGATRQIAHNIESDDRKAQQKQNRLVTLLEHQAILPFVIDYIWLTIYNDLLSLAITCRYPHP
jgi:hypothetical protein